VTPSPRRIAPLTTPGTRTVAGVPRETQSGLRSQPQLAHPLLSRGLRFSLSELPAPRRLLRCGNAEIARELRVGPSAATPQPQGRPGPSPSDAPRPGRPATRRPGRARPRAVCTPVLPSPGRPRTARPSRPAADSGSGSHPSARYARSRLTPLPAGAAAPLKAPPPPSCISNRLHFSGSQL
jgi:hypothetical protein